MKLSLTKCESNCYDKHGARAFLDGGTGLPFFVMKKRLLYMQGISNGEAIFLPC